MLPAGSFDREDAGFWKPLVFAPEQRTRGYHWLGAVGRLQAGVTLDQARAEMRARRREPRRRCSRRSSATGAWPSIRSTGLLVGDSLAQSIIVAFGAVVMVLLIASANIANLLLAKGVARRQEMARARRARRRPRPAGRAGADREPGAVPASAAVAGVGLAYLLIEAAVPLLGPSLPATAALVARPRGCSASPRPPRSASRSSSACCRRCRCRRPAVGSALNLAARGSSSREGARRTDRRRRSRGLAGPDLRRGADVQEPAQAAAGRCRRPHRQRDHDVGRPVARRPIRTPSAPPASSRRSAERLRAVPGVERAAVSTDVPLLGVRQGDAHRRPGHRGRHRRAVQARRSRLLRHARHSGARGPRLHRTRSRRRSARRGRQRGARPHGWRSDSASPIRKRSSGESPGWSNPQYENRGQPGKVEDVEIVGMIRNERVQRSGVAHAGRRLRLAAAVAAARDQADRADAGRSGGRDAAAFARPCGRSIRICRSATCGRWRRSSS